MKNKLLSFLFILAFILTILLLLLLYFANKRTNWQFYTAKSIGPNNQLSLYNNLVFSDQTVFFNSQDQITYAITQKNGQIKWQFQAQDYSPFPPLIDDENIFLSNFDGNIYSLDKKTGYKLWQFTIADNYIPDTPVVLSSSNKLIFFGSRDGVLYALDKTNGQKIWQQEFQTIDTSRVFGQNPIHFGNIYVDQNQVYVMNAQAKSFFALDQLTGQILWQVKDIDFSYQEPIFTENAIIIQRDQYVLSINKKSGTSSKITRQSSSDLSWECFTVVNDSNYILLLDGKTLSKISTDLNQIVWTKDSIDNVLAKKNKIAPSQVTIINQQIFAQNSFPLENNIALLAINYRDGTTLWQNSLNSWTVTQEQNDNILYLGGIDGAVTAIDIKNGQLNWQSSGDGKVDQLLLINEQILSINEKSGEKIALNYFTKDGEKIWQYIPETTIDDINEIYQNGEYIYVLSDQKRFVESIQITNLRPDEQNLKTINFVHKENKNYHDPYLEIEQKPSLTWQMRKKWLQTSYLVKHLSNIGKFTVDEQLSSEILKLTITHDEQLYTNKFLDLQIEATFTRENQTPIKVKGFYYDFNTWQIRFAAPQPGIYQYQIKIKSPYFVKRKTGKIEIKSGQKNKIKLKDNQFTLDGKTAFFPIGLQTAFFDRNYNGDLFEEIPSSNLSKPTNNKAEYAFENLALNLDTYKNEAGMNIFRYGVENVSPALWQSLDLKSFTLSVNGGKFGDQLLCQLKQKDYKVVMTIFGFYPPYRTKKELKNAANQRSLELYLDYVIARFAPYVDLWELSNEAEASRDWYQFVTDYLKKHDPYQKPISTNWETSAAKNLDFLSIHWYNPDEVNPTNLSAKINFLSKKYASFKQPILISEFGFKNHSWFEGSSESMRILTWLNVFHKMGIIFWNQGQNGIYDNPDNANIYLGPIERSYLLSLNNFLPKDMTLPISSANFVASDAETQVYVLKNEKYMLLYLLKTNAKKEAAFKINLDLQNNATVLWIEPKTNQIIKETTMLKGPQEITVPSFKTDLAIKIEYLKPEIAK